jgi:hypothetical protein
MKAYLPLDESGAFNLPSPGIDFNAGFEYPLAEALGLKDKHPLLDFGIGLDLIHIPLLPSSMSDYMEIIVNVGNDEPIDVLDEGGEGLDITIEDDAWGSEKISILRPFKMLVWADWRPLGTQLLTVIPTLGIAANPLYTQPISFEGGIKARLDVSNIFIATLGMGYHDRLFKNSIDFALNFRAVEIDFGVCSQSPDFLKSFMGGVDLSAGLKFGW